MQTKPANGKRKRKTKGFCKNLIFLILNALRIYSFKSAAFKMENENGKWKTKTENENAHKMHIIVIHVSAYNEHY